MAKKLTISTQEYAEAHEHFVEAIRKSEGTKAAASFRERGERGKRQSKRQYRRFREQGGKAGDWPAFLEFLKANWSTILSLLLSLFV